MSNHNHSLSLGHRSESQIADQEQNSYTRGPNAGVTPKTALCNADVSTTTTCYRAVDITTTTETKEKAILVWRFGSTNYSSCREFTSGGNELFCVTEENVTVSV
ncbi:hypothetical protein DPMN_143187 [Dreissena polymorpha]|uniref:Uncharacterized protein n=1 Tax=Dreissena polymorpha TaxID=45954 RepID=A0A9D4GCG6_DREPO|nr:hypothetical protein DPMN_143187 [Dreissena polymorpha]